MPRGFWPNLRVRDDLVGGGVDHRNGCRSFVGHVGERRAPAPARPAQCRRAPDAARDRNRIIRVIARFQMGWRDCARAGRAFMLHDFATCYRRRPCESPMPQCCHRRVFARARRTFTACWRSRRPLSLRARGRRADRAAGRRRRSIPSSSPRRAAPSARSTCPSRSTSVGSDQIQRRPAADQPVRIARARSRASSSRTAGTTRRTCSFQLARLRRARQFRRARRSAVPGQHSRPRCPTARARPAASASLSAQRIEVLRGPFSSLYGNASGGVISVFTEDGPAPPDADGAADRRQLWHLERGSPSATGTAATVNYVVAGNRFETDGYRDHSEATRELVNAKLAFAPAPDTTRHADRQLALPARGAGSARPDARAVGGESAAGGSGGDAVRHAQDRQPAPGRRDRRAALRRRHAICG